MRGRPQIHDLFEPELVCRLGPIEAVERRQEHLEVKHDVVSVLGTQEGAPLLQHLRGGALWEVVATAGHQTLEDALHVPGNCVVVLKFNLTSRL